MLFAWRTTLCSRPLGVRCRRLPTAMCPSGRDFRVLGEHRNLIYMRLFYDTPLTRLASLKRKQQRNHPMLPRQPPQTIFALHHAGDPFAQGERELVKEFNPETNPNQRVEDFAETMVPIV